MLYALSYLTARLEVLALRIDAFVVVDVILPAVLCLVLVREACVEACSHVSSCPDAIPESTGDRRFRAMIGTYPL